MHKVLKCIVSSLVILLLAGVFFLNMSQKTESRPRLVPPPTLDPNTPTPTPKPGDTPVPGAVETLQAKIAAQRPESQYDKITDLSPEMPLKDKSTIIVQHPDGSLEAIVMDPNLLEEQYKKIDPNDLIYNELPPDSTWVVGPMEPPADFDMSKVQAANLQQVQQPMIPPPYPTELMVPYGVDDYSEDQAKQSDSSIHSPTRCCQVFLPLLQK